MIRAKIDVQRFPYKKLDLSYSSRSSSCLLDIFYPNDQDIFPCVLCIHGGAFKKGDKRNGDMIEPMLHGLDRGIAVIGINYRLSPEAAFPAAIEDVKDAILYIKSNAEMLRIDPEKMVVWGQSAGGYLSIMSALLTNLPFISNEQDLRIRGAIAWFPPVNFATMNEQLRENHLFTGKHDHDRADSPESLFMGYCIGDHPEKVQTANPENYIYEGMCPLLIQHGRKDQVVPYQQSFHFYEKMKNTKNDIYYEIVEDADHGDLLFERSENIQIVFQFIENCLK